MTVILRQLLAATKLHQNEDYFYDSRLRLRSIDRFRNYLFRSVRNRGTRRGLAYGRGDYTRPLWGLGIRNGRMYSTRGWCVRHRIQVDGRISASGQAKIIRDLIISSILRGEAGITIEISPIQWLLELRTRKRCPGTVGFVSASRLLRVLTPNSPRRKSDRQLLYRRYVS
jgi:hypothetical protein